MPDDCVFEHCRFVNSGAAGLRVDLHAQRNVVRHCEFRDLGGVGVLLAGYGMGWKDVNRGNVVEDCRFVRIGREWWGSPAIFVWQSGENRIVHNLIREIPYSGIVISGRTQLNVSGLKESSRTARWDEVVQHLENEGRSWHAREPLMHGRNNEVAWNDISGGDAGPVGWQRDSTFREPVAATECTTISFTTSTAPTLTPACGRDDDQYQVTFANNVVARCTGEGIVLKGGNALHHNLVYDLRPQTSDGTNVLFQRGYLVLSGQAVSGAVIENNAFVSRTVGQNPLLERTERWEKNGRPMPPDNPGVGCRPQQSSGGAGLIRRGAANFWLRNRRQVRSRGVWPQIRTWLIHKTMTLGSAKRHRWRFGKCSAGDGTFGAPDQGRKKIAFVMI